MFFFVSALAIAGCAKEPQAGTTPAGPDAQETNFSLVASSDVFTKTELQGQTILWKAGDKISVWEKESSNSNLPFDLDEASANSPTGLFKGTLTPAAEFELLSIYPYSEAYGDDPTALALTIPSTVDQATDINSLIGASDFMVGQASSEDVDAQTGGYKMRFQHPLAFVKFVIDGSNCVFSDATIKSLTMTANVAFVGPVSVNLEDGTVTSAAQDDEGDSLVVNFPATAKMNTEQVAWVAINPVDLSDAGCQFVLEMTNGQKVTFTVNPSKMNGQALYEFQFKDIDAKIAAGKGATTPVRIDKKEDGSYCPANCYIVKEGGYYQFDARSVDKVNLWSAEGTYSAKWLWSTGTESIVDNVGFSTKSGRITIRVKPNSNGNAVVALYKDGAIVWSWHIWCVTMDSPMAPHHYTANTTYWLSDINLGATSKTPGDVNSYGMYYQWGRKDPFPADKANCVFNTNVTIKGTSAVSSGSLAYSIANPTVIFYENARRTWISSDEAPNAQSYWNKETEMYLKTNYDPCPPGYCVPITNGRAWSAYNTANQAPTFTSENIAFGTYGLTYTLGDVSTYYPAAGYLAGGTLTDAGKTVRLWAANLSATPSATANMFGYSLLCTLSSSAIKTNEGSRAAFALPIRCMKQ